MVNTKALAKVKKASGEIEPGKGRQLRIIVAGKNGPTLQVGASNSAEKMEGAIVGLKNSCGEARGIVAGGKNDCSYAAGAIIGGENTVESADGAMIGGQNICKEGRGALIGVLNGALSTLKGIAIGVANYAESLKGVQIGLANVSDDASVGLQIGVLNFRMYGPWYTRMIPGVAIRFAGLFDRKHDFRPLHEKILGKDKAVEMKEANRRGLIDFYKTENPGEEILGAAYRGTGLTEVDEKAVLEKLKRLAFEKGIGSRKKIAELGKMLEDDGEQARRSAAEHLTLIVCDPEIYGKSGSLLALKTLVDAAEKAPEGEVCEALERIGATGDMLRDRSAVQNGI